MGLSWRFLGGSDLKVISEVPRLNASEYNYGLFWKEYMRANKPVLLTGLMDSWRACREWVLESGAPNLTFIAENFGRSRVLVADCGRKEFTDQKRQEMTVLQFIEYWQKLRENRMETGSQPDQLLYLKDWHFVKDFPAYCAYKTPEAFSDDWLNSYLDAFQMHSVNAEITPKKADNDNQCSDYRFVYMGPKGTWTPLHADVFRSYSWSGNVCGRKRWFLLPPEQVHLSYDRFGRDTVYDVCSEVSAQQFPGFCETRWIECNQGPGEILFVPSGWFHQVINVEDTISINHNWLNACNISWAWKLLKTDYRETVESIEDIRSISDDFELLCQRNLAANSGMNYLDFTIFLAKMADSSIKFQSDLYPGYLGHDNSNELSELGKDVWKNNARQCLFNLLQIKQILEEMSHEELFQHGGESFPVGISCKHLDLVEKLRVESKDKVSAVVGQFLIQGERSPEIRFVSEFLSRFFAVNPSCSDCVGNTTESRCEFGKNLDGDVVEKSKTRKAAAEISGRPLVVLRCIQYIIDMAARSGIIMSDVESYSITLPRFLTVEPS
ncbi:hypothetical protein R1flu_027082 [Riccia fluitans]|uniref:JmjC domain-containing protein n=1 Tax=Riccia fluitans TaxID=41844 RepID=A0ABD1XHS3_9MARC